MKACNLRRTKSKPRSNVLGLDMIKRVQCLFLVNGEGTIFGQNKYIKGKGLNLGWNLPFQTLLRKPQGYSAMYFF